MNFISRPTDTVNAPWYVIPADHKWVSRAMVAAIVARAIAGLDLKYAKVTDAQRRQIAEAKQQLENER